MKYKREIKLSEIDRSIKLDDHFSPNTIVGNTHRIVSTTKDGYMVEFLLDPGISGEGNFYRKLFIKKEWIK